MISTEGSWPQRSRYKNLHVGMGQYL
jgi:hypothetical protein